MVYFFGCAPYYPIWPCSFNLSGVISIPSQEYQNVNEIHVAYMSTNMSVTC